MGPTPICRFAFLLVGVHLLLAWVGGNSLAQYVQKGDKDKKFIEDFVKAFGEPVRIRESKPVTVNDAKFTAIAQTDWIPGKGYVISPLVAPIEIQLQITNLSKSDVLFPTFKTFGIKILNAKGKEMKVRRSFSGANPTRPVVLTGGASYAVCRSAELRWDETTKAAELSYHDGTGGQSLFGPLEPGQYKLVFWYSVMPDKNQKHGNTPIWSGEVVTSELAVDVLDGTVQGVVTCKHDVRPFSEPVRIRESKPVAMNDARFVAVAQVDWKGDKQGGGVPLEIQLRITNLSKKDLVFPTFDTFGVSLSFVDGKHGITGGARLSPCLTRPILLPPGTSYFLGPQGDLSRVGRRAELHWDEKTNTSKLLYLDGTGTTFLSGPIQAGQYRLAFWYYVGAQGPFRTGRDSATWLGLMFTDDVFVNLHNP